MKQNIDVMTGEALVQTDQVAITKIENSSILQRAAAGVLACAAVTLSLPGGAGVPSPKAESVTMEIDQDDNGDPPGVPRQRIPKVYGNFSITHR